MCVLYFLSITVSTTVLLNESFYSRRKKYDAKEQVKTSYPRVFFVKLVQQAEFRPVGREDVEGWRLLACLEGLLQWDGQRLAVKQLLVLNSGTPESLPHGDVLKRH